MTPEEKREVHRLRCEGLTHRAIAERIGTASRTAVARELQRPPPPDPVPVPHAAFLDGLRDAHADDPEPIDADADAITLIRREIRAAIRAADRAAAAGDVTAEKQNRATVARFAPVLASLEREERKGADVVTVTFEEFARAREDLEARFRALTDRPLLCAQCGRELSIQWSGAREKGKPE